MMSKTIARLCAAVVVGIAAVGSAVPGARAETELTVYTAWENDDLEPFKEAFESDNPDIEINWVRDSTGIITAKLIAEKDNPHADVVWGLAVTSMGLLDEYGMLHPYEPKGFDRLSPKFKDSATPPHWFGNSGWICAIIFNEIEAEELGIPKPTSWKDLADPAYKGQIVMPHPASSGTGFMYVSAWLQTYGEKEGWAFMDALHENVARYMHSGSAPGVTAARGEYVVGLSFEVRGSRLKEQGAPIDVILPGEGLGWDMQTFAIIEGTDKLDAAKRLADWAASEEAMKLYGSVRSVTALPGVAQKLPHLPANLEDRVMDQDFAWASTNREEILAEWERRYGSKADPNDD